MPLYATVCHQRPLPECRRTLGMPQALPACHKLLIYCLRGIQGAPLHKIASFVYNVCMEKPWAVLDTSFWVIGHRVDVLSYVFRFFTVCVPDAVRHEVLSPDPRYPLRVYGYQEFFRLLEVQGALHIRNPAQRVPQFHVGEA